MTDRKLRRERERVERTRGQPVEFARSSHFDVLIPIYGDGTVGDPALYPLSTDDLVEAQGPASHGCPGGEGPGEGLAASSGPPRRSTHGRATRRQSARQISDTPMSALPPIDAMKPEDAASSSFDCFNVDEKERDAMTRSAAVTLISRTASHPLTQSVRW